MNKSAQFERKPARHPLNRESCCSPNSLCLRCSMILVISHRFAVFDKKFGRLPGPDDELFFDETQSQPVRAGQHEIRNQIFAAAQAHGLNFLILSSYLGLSSTVAYDEEPQ